MDALNHVLLAGGLLLAAAIVLAAVSARIGVPFLLVFLAVGMLAGEDGPGGIAFDDVRLSYLVGNVALAIILIDGGLRTQLATFRVALKPALALATIGVAATALALAAFAHYALGVDWYLALLLGAIVSSTDAAAVFALLKSSGVRLNPRVGSTLEIESGVNDPMAVFLTVSLIALAGTWGSGGSLDAATLLAAAWSLVVQFAIGAAAGLALGWLLAWTLVRLATNDGLQAILLGAAAVGILAAVNGMGGSGFLAVYLAGLVVSNRKEHATEPVLRAMDGLAWLAQSGMFLILGLLVTPSEIPRVLGAGIAIALFLMFVARPLGVWLCLAPLRFQPRETLYIGWIGLRGAVPIVLALFPLLAGIEGARTVFNLAFVVVLASLLLQGSTVALAARALRMALADRAEPLARSALHAAPQTELVELQVPRASALVGESPAAIEWPTGARPIGVTREGRFTLAADAAPLAAGDIVAFVAHEDALERLGALFAAARRGDAGRADARDVELVLDGSAEALAVLGFYAPPAAALAREGESLDAFVRRLLGAPPVEGDSCAVKGLELTVREMQGERVTRVTLRLPRQPA